LKLLAPGEALATAKEIEDTFDDLPGRQPTGKDVKKGFEAIHDLTLGGLVPPLEVNAADHEGGGWVQVFQVKGGKFIKETDWFRAYPEVIAQAIAKAE
jgi:branched-chain amino acid transport system substrate-binding protein